MLSAGERYIALLRSWQRFVFRRL